MTGINVGIRQHGRLVMGRVWELVLVLGLQAKAMALHWRAASLTEFEGLPFKPTITPPTPLQ